MRHLILIATAAAAFVGLVAMESAEAAQLRGEAVVDGPSLTLGHLFRGLDTDIAERPVAPAPAEGNTVRLGSDWLSRVARAHSVDWVPDGDDAGIVVRRQTADERAATAAALADELAAFIDANQIAPVVVPEPEPEPEPEPVVAEPEPEPEPLVIEVAETREMPATVRVIRPGETISLRDIVWVEVNDGRRAYDFVQDVDELIGMAARRTIGPDQPIRFSDLTLPVIVEKGDSVTMVVEHGSMTITARGRALDDGALHDVIRVMNVDSSQTIDATVAGTGRVSVAIAPALAYAN